MAKNKSFAVVGAGIIGCGIARELAMRRASSITVIEKENHLGAYASGHNSGVLHSGINQRPESLKAKMCIAGNALAKEFCRKNGVKMNECGTYVVARNTQEEKMLDELFSLGNQCGVSGLRIFDQREFHEKEPAISAIKALFSPNGAVLDSIGFLNAVAEDAKKRGVSFLMGVEAMRMRDGCVITNCGDIHADHIINAAGLSADTLAHECGVGSEYTIVPFRGCYFQVKNLDVRAMVYQVPDLRYPFLGVHFTRCVSGRVLAGPTATLSFRHSASMFFAPNFWRLVSSAEFLRLAAKNFKLSFLKNAFVEELKTFAPQVTAADLSPAESGIRAQLVDRSGRLIHDMVLEFRQGETHILNAISPGMTSVLSFAQYIVDNILKFEL